MGIDLTDDDWLQTAAPPLKYSELVSDEETVHRVRQELIPVLATELEDRAWMPESVQESDPPADSTESRVVARAILQSVSDTRLRAVTAEVDQHLSREDISPQQFAELYVNAVVEALLARMDESEVRRIAHQVGGE